MKQAGRSQIYCGRFNLMFFNLRRRDSNTLLLKKSTEDISIHSFLQYHQWCIRSRYLHLSLHDRADRKSAVPETIIADTYKSRYKVEAQRTIRKWFVAR